MPHHDESRTAPKRRDAARSERVLLDAAARVFAEEGVDATVRRIAVAAGVGMGTLYRHFPTRSDLMVAVYRHQIDACAEAGPALLRSAASPFEALMQWVHQFVGFLATKHGLGNVWQGDTAGITALHRLFLDRLVPVLADLLEAARRSGDVVADVGAYELIRAVGDLVAWDVPDPDYDVRRIVTLLVMGLRQTQSTAEPRSAG